MDVFEYINVKVHFSIVQDDKAHIKMKTIKLEKCVTNINYKTDCPNYKEWIEIYKINVQASLKSDERK